MFLYAFTGDKGSSSNISSMAIPNWEIPLIKDIPIQGDILSGHQCPDVHRLRHGHPLLVPDVPHTPGAAIPRVGENDKAARSVGESPPVSS